MRQDEFFEGLDDAAETGRFFVALAERLRDQARGEEDLAHVAHALRLPLPRELRGATIETIEDGRSSIEAADLTSIVITYPPIPTPDPPTVELSFKKCFRVCKKVSGATVCAEVCVDIDVSLDGVHGSVKATVTVHF